jgi:hypothetical protein
MPSKIILAIALCAGLIGPALAQQTKSFWDSRGSFTGSSVTRGRQTDYFDRRGSFAGSSFSQGTPSNPHGNRK